MKYFTPELYVAFNARDIDTMAHADEAWDRAEAKYERRLQAIRPDMPPVVKLIADEYCLHDAEILQVIEAPGIVQLRVQKWNVEFVLDYRTTAPANSSIPCPSDVFSPHFPRWLYDEIDLIRPGVYSHNVLLSDGRVLRIEFDALHIHELHPTGTAEKLRAADEILPVAKRISRTRADAGGQICLSIPQTEMQAMKHAIKTIKANSDLHNGTSTSASVTTKPAQTRVKQRRGSVSNRKSTASRKSRPEVRSSKKNSRS